MSVEKIKSLLELMRDNDLVELKLREGDFKVVLRKPGAVIAQPAIISAGAPIAAPAATPAAPVKGAAPAEGGLVPIKSPIVGTFYRSPTPEAQPFVNEGSRVSKDTVVCIIEAMKIMNEIRAELSGTIEKVLVENGEPVEYGQPLYLVRL